MPSARRCGAAVEQESGPQRVSSSRRRYAAVLRTSRLRFRRSRNRATGRATACARDDAQRNSSSHLSSQSQSSSAAPHEQSAAHRCARRRSHAEVLAAFGMTPLGKLRCKAGPKISCAITFAALFVCAEREKFGYCPSSQPAATCRCVCWPSLLGGFFCFRTSI